MGKSRRSEHQQFLSWLITTAVNQKVDAIIVAGDIFDTGSPPSYARELYNQFIVDLQSTGINLIILAGNHDSVATLSESKELLACLNTHVVPAVSADLNEQVITLNKHNQTPLAIVCAIPYIRPRDVIKSVAGQNSQMKAQTLQMAIQSLYQRTYDLAKDKQHKIFQKTNNKVPIIATGHLTTLNAKSSDSVRDIYIGSLEAFPLSAFPPADYIALGHIHRAQLIGARENVRYCGSPIPLSFDELNNDKVILIAEFDQASFVEVSVHKIPQFQPMHLIKGDLSEIEEQIVELATRYDFSLPAWLDIEITTHEYLSDLQQRIQQTVENLPLEVLLLRRNRKQQLLSLKETNHETLQELTPKDVFQRRLLLEDWTSEEMRQKKIRINKAFEEILEQVEHSDKKHRELEE